MEGGQLVEILDFATLHFNVTADRATGFEQRLPNDHLMMTGKRVP
jgi:hypothetical protein